ncbi:MAG: hypothetical protein M1819_005713 [Sarea resinae]|nr:MAG: hypothetical protein M1819_005713 [Sarea resinae]
MFPPSQGINLDIEALSGICGSISIACWVVVFSPQIIENFRRGSADGLSLLFIIVWLAGDVFNILGAVLQGVLPTMVILAVYYTLADIVLLCQCFYYRGFTLSDSPSKPSQIDDPTEETSLLDGNNHISHNGHRDDVSPHTTAHNRSTSSFRRLSTAIDATHLSPATPLLDAPKPSDPPAAESLKPTSTLQTILFNTFAIILVCAAGVFGWWVSNHPSRSSHHHHHHGNDGSNRESHAEDDLTFSLWGQIFGYFCAVLYLGSRIPQILLNYRRKSTEGVSMLFFLFACIGNLTYVLSILAYSPVCLDHSHYNDDNGSYLSSYPKHDRHGCTPSEASSIYLRHFLVNFSWLLGSFGTLILDLAIFVQFFIYRHDDDDNETDPEAVERAPQDGRQANGDAQNVAALEGQGEGRGRSPPRVR